MTLSNYQMKVNKCRE